MTWVFPSLSSRSHVIVVPFHPGKSPKHDHATRRPGSSSSTRIRAGTGAPGNRKIATEPFVGSVSLFAVQNPASPFWVVIASKTVAGDASTSAASRTAQPIAFLLSPGFTSLRADYLRFNLSVRQPAG